MNWMLRDVPVGSLVIPSDVVKPGENGGYMPIDAPLGSSYLKDDDFFPALVVEKIVGGGVRLLGKNGVAWEFSTGALVRSLPR